MPTTPFAAPGSNVTARPSFNSATLDFGNQRIVYVENIALTIGYTLTDLFVLGSIKPQDKVRHSQKVSLTGQLKSYAPELEMLALGSSAIGTPNNVNTMDGQASVTNPVLTIFDRTNKQMQYQFSSATFKSTKLTSKMEDYSQWDFELEALDIAEVYTA